MSLIEQISGLALRYLNPGRMEKLRNAYFSGRRQLFPVMRKLYGTFDSAELRKHLEQQIGDDFEILMVHSSLNYMKPMYTEGPMEFVKMLRSFCGPDRTLVMPAFYFGDPNIGGAYPTFKQNPRFNLKRTPSQMGLATELFRRTPGVIQSRHPVYRVAALGPHAKELTAGQEQCRYPSGIGSPFDYMAKHNTRIIGIGKDFHVLTQVHHAEAVMGDEFPVPRNSGEALKVTVVDGSDEVEAALFGDGPLWRLNMDKLKLIMDQETLREWRFHHVPIFSVRAADVTSSLIEAAERGFTLYDKP